ncbi:ATP-dependent helicase [Kytococcus schroeteri]|uniref:ATP-dependent helicase n=1 Tax=Kytococcus schroeteri TaxID=138300 RepID=UPI00114367DD|nr:UrvD/REP family ATP-dependent DNA helicase [Kytococcus schroeteri]
MTPSPRAHLVLGAPGTGRSTRVVEEVLAHLEGGGDLSEVLVLAPSRLTASMLRERLEERWQRGATGMPVYSHQAFGFSVLSHHARLTGAEPPSLLTGADQDAVLADLLAGVAGDDAAFAAAGWPEEVRAAVGTQGFRDQVRDLFMRAVEHGVTAGELAALDDQQGECGTSGLWRAAAGLMREYEQVTALADHQAVDAAWVVAAAADLLVVDDALAQVVAEPLRLVLVDDAQELTAGTQALLDALAVRAPDARWVLVGDPDAAVQGFRGARPGAFVEWAGDPEPEVLGRSVRHGPVLRAVADRVTARIGATAVAHRRPAPAQEGDDGERAEALVLPSAHAELAQVATLLRREHVMGGVPWRRMAVLARGRGRTEQVRRALERAGVPVQVSGGGQPAGSQPVVSTVLDLVDAALDLARQGTDDPAAPVVDEARVTRWLTSPVGGLDSSSVRRLRRVLRTEAGTDSRATSGELLVAAVTDPAHPWERRGAETGALRRLATALQAGVAAAPRAAGGRGWAVGVDAETVLWAVWDGLGVSASWQRQALAGGVAGQRADRDLDAVLGLFAAAEQFVERHPGAGPEVFTERMRSSQVARDSLVLGREREAVQVLTPQAAAGREWEVVAVVGVQTGVWPDLRLRGSLVGSSRLVELVEGRTGGIAEELAAVRHDELRQFLVACTRATRRLVVTAVRDAEETPSPFLDLVDPLPEGVEQREFAPWSVPVDLRHQVAHARRELLHAAGAVPEADEPAGAGTARTDPGARAAWAAELAALVRAEVPHAHPEAWWALRQVSSAEAPWAPGTLPVVRPSSLGTWQDCGLKWFLTTHGGSTPPGRAQEIGTLLHDLLAEHPEAPLEELRAEAARRREELGSPEVWWSRREGERMAQWLRRYDVYRRECGRELVGTELALRVEAEGVRLTGRVDRLERHPGSGALHVADLKTGHVGSPKDLPDNAQLGAYQVAVEAGAFEAGDHSGGASLVQLDSGEKVGTIDRRQPALADGPVDHRARVAEAGVGMVQARHVATVGEACRHCPVRSSCPARPEGKEVA